MSKLNKKMVWTDDGVKEVAFNNNKLYNNNMKKVSLTLKERHLLFGVLATWKGGMDEMPFVSDDVKAVNVTDEEWKKANRVIHVWVKMKEGGVEVMIDSTKYDGTKMDLIPEKNGYWTWDEKKVADKEVEVSPASAKYLKKLMDDKSAKNEIELKDKDLVDLLKKIS